MILPGTWMRLTGWQFLGSSFLSVLKMGAMFPFYFSPRASSDFHDFPNTMENG